MFGVRVCAQRLWRDREARQRALRHPASPRRATRNASGCARQRWSLSSAGAQFGNRCSSKALSGAFVVQGSGLREFGTSFFHTVQRRQQIARTAGNHDRPSRPCHSQSIDHSRPAAGPSCMATATARFNSITGESRIA